MKNLSLLMAALLLMLNMACQNDEDVSPVSDEKKQLMAKDWGVDQVDVATDYSIKTPLGETPVKQNQSLTALSSNCEYAGTMRFAEEGIVAIAYLQNFCGQENPDANDIKWSSDDKVTELTLIGKNLAGLSVDIQGNHLSNGNEAIFKVKELTAQKLVLERTIPIISFFTSEVLALYASQGVSFDGNYSYTTTYLAK